MTSHIRLIHIHCFHQKVDVVTSPSNLLQGRRFFPIHMSAAHGLSTVDFTRTAKPHHTCRNVLSLKMYTIHPQALKVSWSNIYGNHAKIMAKPCVLLVPWGEILREKLIYELTHQSSTRCSIRSAHKISIIVLQHVWHLKVCHTKHVFRV